MRTGKHVTSPVVLEGGVKAPTPKIKLRWLTCTFHWSPMGTSQAALAYEIEDRSTGAVHINPRGAGRASDDAYPYTQATKCAQLTLMLPWTSISTVPLGRVRHLYATGWGGRNAVGLLASCASMMPVLPHFSCSSVPHRCINALLVLLHYSA